MDSIGHQSNQPRYRRLRVYAIDPSLQYLLETTDINETVLHLDWEENLQPGPVGEYLEVIDYDPASRSYYAPVNLNEPELLAQDGLPLSVGSPQFHQQMVYAVAMNTIHNFEKALGRVVFWKRRFKRDKKGIREIFVEKLRIYPHALREANAYYSGRKKALLFGYFFNPRSDSNNVLGTLVFTCLSFDVIAHETTHALLDGLHSRFSESTNPDVLAFHEAFADIVALFQHFSIPGVLRHEIARTRGVLENQNMLGRLAQEFGRAIGRGEALRDALGAKDENDKWKAHDANPKKLKQRTEPHERGAILVAAVFDAFLLIYKSRIADLLRIATHGSGDLPSGNIHPDLVDRLAGEASKSARHILQICIRALDYCPPMDITFGDYLRAIITADYDLYPEDKHRYRVAVIEAFRRWGIYPKGIRALSLESLLWPTVTEAHLDLRPIEEVTAELPSTDAKGSKEKLYSKSDIQAVDQAELLQDLSQVVAAQKIQEPLELSTEQLTETLKEKEDTKLILSADWGLGTDRKVAWNKMRTNGAKFHYWLTEGDGQDYLHLFGLSRSINAAKSIFRDQNGYPAIEVHSVRTAIRKSDEIAEVTELVIEMTQSRRGYFDLKKQARIDRRVKNLSSRVKGDFTFRTGCTILINPITLEIRRVIRTQGTIEDNAQLERVRSFLTRESLTTNNAFHATPYRDSLDGEEFARLHRSYEKESSK